MEDVARQLLRAVRGSRSQVAFSRRLGYRGNPVADWEAGRRFPTAAEALRACTVAGLDVRGAFKRFHAESAAELRLDDDGLAAWLRVHQGGSKVVEIAERIDRSRYAVSRWLSGQTRPRLPDFLRLVDALTGRTPDLVAELVPIGAVPDIADELRARRAAYRLAFDEPWTAAVLRALETDGYQALELHDPDWVAGLLDLPVTTVRRCLEELERAGVIRWVGDRLVVAGQLTVDTRAEPAEMRALGAHWTTAALGRQRAPRRPGDLFSYNVFSVSNRDLERIREAHLAYFREVRAIVAASEPCEAVVLINVQLMTWTPPTT